MAENGGHPKLLVVIGTLAHMGGAERQALYLVGHLSRLARCRVEVLAFHDGQALRPQLESLGVRVHVLPYYFRWPQKRRLKALAQMTRLLRFTIKPDALLPFVGIHSKVMAQVWPFSGARFCWWNQQDEGRDLNGTPEEKRILRKVSAITSNSLAGRDFLAATYGIDPASILVYNNGTPEMKPIISDTFRSRLQLGERQVVSMIANVTPYKDHATLIDAWSIVRDHFKSREIPVLVLAGSVSDRATVSRLQMQAFELGLSSDDIKFLGPVEDVSGLMSESDLVVHSSLTEGCPNAVCEAMALGRAVVGTDIPGMRQALGENSRECLAPAKDAATLAARIVAMLENDELRNAQGMKNLKRIKADFSIEAMNSFFQGVIEKGLGAALATG